MISQEKRREPATPPGPWGQWLDASVNSLHARSLFRTLRPTVPGQSAVEVGISQADIDAWIAGQPPASSPGAAPLPALADAPGLRTIKLFSLNDYLGLSTHPAVRRAAAEAALQCGNGPRSSALVGGYTRWHAELEAALAQLKGTQECLLFPSGFSANLAVAAAICDAAGGGSTGGVAEQQQQGPRQAQQQGAQQQQAQQEQQVVLLSDELNHASIVDGARLGRRVGARLLVYRHNDLAHLESLLQAEVPPGARAAVLTDSLFSMDGDFADLAGLAALRRKYSFLLVVDDAHATLVCGERGGGAAEMQGVAGEVDLHVGTLSKAFGCLGGFVACSARWKDLLVNRGRSQVFSTALPVPTVAAALAALRVAAQEPWRREHVWRLAQRLGSELGVPVSSPIVPLIIGPEAAAVGASMALLQRGFHVPAIRPPTVPPGTSRLRVSLSAAHSEQDLLELLAALRGCGLSFQRGGGRRDGSGGMINRASAPAALDPSSGMQSCHRNSSKPVNTAFGPLYSMLRSATKIPAISEAVRALAAALPRMLAGASTCRPPLSAAPQQQQRRAYAPQLGAASSYPRLDAPTFRYAVLEAPLAQPHETQGSGAIPRHLLPFAQRMAALGGQRAAGKEATYEAAVSAARAGLPFALVLGTGGTEGAALQLARHYHREFLKAQQAAAGELPHEPLGTAPAGTLPPLLLVAHPYSNSLPSALETLARLQQDGLRARCVYLAAAAGGGNVPGEHGWGTLQASLHAVRVWHALHRTRIGLVGPPSPWLLASAPPAPAVEEAWGPQLIDIDMQELMRGLWGGGAFKQKEVDAVVKDMTDGGSAAAHTHAEGEAAGECPACGTPPVADPAPAARVYLAMRKLVDAHALSCITVRCFDLVSAQETTGCYSLARLLDEDVIAGCEGDVCSALGMLWGKLMTVQVPWMANVAQVDCVDGVLKLAHCTVARSLLSEHEATTHFESGLGVAVKGTLPPGSVTLLRIGGARLERLWVEEGYVLQEQGNGTEWSPRLCRTQVRVRMLGGKPVVEGLLQRPLGSHVVLLRGHHRAALQSYWSQFGPGAAAA
ncbi:8-amino-7-oxononanoate synthase isoform A [Micractinium conductrix]|uniref:8-amino-7-oxononanoate synthase isoform A n=1 Tax=Micractinium conductrix TaxID=554055 RepID=A0A2P6V5Y6_9CHLO|nr:8-amino-7-oxononanoate synthase isoform A [Micractinium conductrix]|eukprot:PSC69499.1 8-amino-7-oxononanoate synthase isoform A [Micractinium conductrix]